ncbi:MAG: hypothetical protein ABSF21_00045 [Dehalococcoidia bacterium]
MYLNDIYGDCVIAGRAHMTLPFEKFQQGIQIQISDDEIKNEYFAETGGQDTGLVMLDSLNVWRKEGWTAGGKHYDIYAFASLDWTNHDEVRAAIYLLRGIYLGFQVPQSAIDQFNAGKIWDVVTPDGGIQGGHCIYTFAFIDIVGYNEIGPVCMTWGRRQQMTWRFWDSQVDEAYVVIDNINKWQNPATDPLDIPALVAYLNEITHVIPPVEPPAPPTPPAPVPPGPTPSTCPVGNGMAKAFSVLPGILRRQGRFLYMNPPRK